MTKQKVLGLLAAVALLVVGCSGATKTNEEWIREAASAYAAWSGETDPASLRAAGDALEGVSRSPDGGAASDALHDSGRHYHEAAAAAEAGTMGALADAIEAGAQDMDRANVLIEKMGGFDVLFEESSPSANPVVSTTPPIPPEPQVVTEEQTSTPTSLDLCALGPFPFNAPLTSANTWMVLSEARVSGDGLAIKRAKAMASIQAQWRATGQRGPSNGKQFAPLGDFGPQGRLVVQQLQEANGVSPTGAIDAETWSLLQEEYC